jgi:hypothetical protein
MSPHEKETLRLAKRVLRIGYIVRLHVKHGWEAEKVLRKYVEELRQIEIRMKQIRRAERAST